MAVMPDAGFIIHERGKSHFWQGVGLLSIKSFSQGVAYYDVGCGRYAVDTNSYLILNHGQPYSITIDSCVETESFCVFFDSKLASDVALTSNATTAHRLNHPEDGAEILFVERTYPHDDLVSPALLKLKSEYCSPDFGALQREQALHGLLERMLNRNHRSLKEAESSISALKPSTRQELYRRLHRARDYAAACRSQPLTVIDLSRIACLSPNHFLRSFTQVFRKTPHQYLTSLRLEAAQSMLGQTDLPVTEVCFSVGFESLGSFSSLFRRHCGVSPSQYRATKK
jgi:AraC-like DNA-binding protein